MASSPRVSVIVIFLNEERFLESAIASVYGQSFTDWELLLVDDGSTDASTGIAKDHVVRDPGRVRYVEHPGHANLGMSAARNAGLAEARGEFVAFLDADDVWLPHRLERSVALLEADPEADMVYGRSLYWSSWRDSDGGARDWIQPHGFLADRTIAPPELLRIYLGGAAALPCPSSMTVRLASALASGGFVEEFRSLYEDQAFLARFCLDHAVYVSEESWSRYRLHPDSACAIAERNATAHVARQAYHAWLASLLERRGLRGTELWDVAARARAELLASGRWRARIRRSARRASQKILRLLRRSQSHYRQPGHE